MHTWADTVYPPLCPLSLFPSSNIDSSSPLAPRPSPLAPALASAEPRESGPGAEAGVVIG